MSSLRMGRRLLCRQRTRTFRFDPPHHDAARLRTSEEANAASGAALAEISDRMIPVAVQIRSQLQHLRRTGLDAQPAALALFRIQLQTPAIGGFHVSLPHSQ